MEVVEDLGDHNVEDDVGTNCSDGKDAEHSEYDRPLAHDAAHIFSDSEGLSILPEETIEVEDHGAKH